MSPCRNRRTVGAGKPLVHARRTNDRDRFPLVQPLGIRLPVAADADAGLGEYRRLHSSRTQERRARRHCLDRARRYTRLSPCSWHVHRNPLCALAVGQGRPRDHRGATGDASRRARARHRSRRRGACTDRHGHQRQGSSERRAQWRRDGLGQQGIEGDRHRRPPCPAPGRDRSGRLQGTLARSLE